MGTTHIEITNVRSRPASVIDEEDESSHQHGVPLSHRASPDIYAREGPSRSSGSEPHDIIHLDFPHEQYPERYPPSEVNAELDLSDSASRIDAQRRPALESSRSSSQRREIPIRRTTHRDPGPGRVREQARVSPTESIVSSAEDFARQPYPPLMPRPQSYYADGYPNVYAHSNSSGSGHPQMGMPVSNQMVHYAAPAPAPMPYPPQYSHIPPPHPGYPPSHHGYMPPPMIHQAPSLVSSPYSGGPYPPPGMMPYGAPPSGYFPPQYQPQYPHPPYMDSWRVQSPPLPVPMPMQPPPAPVEVEKAKADPDDIAKRIEALILKDKEERLKLDAEAAAAAKAEAAIREEKAKAEAALLAEKAKAEATALAEKAKAEAIMLAEKAKADAASQAEKIAHEQRIRDEATAAAEKAAAAKAAAAAEKAVWEQRIKEEAAAAALKAKADEEAAKAQRAADDKKIADEAAAAAKAAAEKTAADEAAKAKEAAEKAQKEAEAKVKEAEEAAEKAKKEAEEAAKKVPSDDKKPPIRFHDAVGRKFEFPFELCAKWRSMETLIQQAFQHVDVIGPHVMDGRYDLTGPTGAIILPHVWDSVIQPDWVITMHMWPMEKEEPLPPTPPPLDDFLDLDALLNPGKKKSHKEKDKDKDRDRDRDRDRDKVSGAPKKKTGKTGGFAAWMMPGTSSSSRAKANGKGKARG